MNIFKIAYYLCLVIATVLFSITSYSQSTKITLEIKSVSAQTPTTQNLKTQAFLLNQRGVEQLNASRFEEALDTFQQLLTVSASNSGIATNQTIQTACR
jgi:hypothetical protein